MYYLLRLSISSLISSICIIEASVSCQSWHLCIFSYSDWAFPGPCNDEWYPTESWILWVLCCKSASYFKYAMWLGLLWPCASTPKAVTILIDGVGSLSSSVNSSLLVNAPILVTDNHPGWEGSSSSLQLPVLICVDMTRGSLITSGQRWML